MNINKKLQEYIEKNIYPEYDKNEKGHNIDHILGIFFFNIFL